MASLRRHRQRGSRFRGWRSVGRTDCLRERTRRHLFRPGNGRLKAEPMGYHTIPNSAIKYGLIAYEPNGHERSEAGRNFTQTLLREIAAQNVTNVFFFSHGWKGDVPAAIDQYDRWIGA